MRKGIFCFLLLISFQISSDAAAVKGKVIDAETKEPLSNVNVIIPAHRAGDATNLDGRYIIQNIAPGNYLVQANLIGYTHYAENICIENEKDTVELNIELSSFIKWDSVSTPELEAYHAMIATLNNKEPVLKIVIDSLEFVDSKLQIHLSMTNTIEDTIYVLKTYPCSSIVGAIIRDNNGNEKKGNMTLIDCMGEKTCVDESDLILIPPHSEIEYPVYNLWNYRFDIMPKGNYSLKIEYEFEKKEKINEYWCGNDSNIKALITALRGKYVSSNTITFENK